MWKKKTTDLKKKSPNLKNKLDTVFSRFIRLRDARKDGTFQCISCG
ncbi:recombinase, partial [Bacteroides fragilis]